MASIKLSGANFQTEVLKSKEPVLVDFWAEWCGPCKMISPIIDEIAKEMSGKLKVGKVNVDEEQDLAAKYEIMSIPTLLLFKNGQAVDMIVGALGKEQLLSKLKPNLA